MVSLYFIAPMFTILPQIGAACLVVDALFGFYWIIRSSRMMTLVVLLLAWGIVIAWRHRPAGRIMTSRGCLAPALSLPGLTGQSRTSGVARTIETRLVSDCLIELEDRFDRGACDAIGRWSEQMIALPLHLSVLDYGAVYGCDLFPQMARIRAESGVVAFFEAVGGALFSYYRRVHAFSSFCGDPGAFGRVVVVVAIGAEIALFVAFLA